MSLSMQGMGVPELSKIDIKTFPGLMDKARKIYEYEQKNSLPNNSLKDGSSSSKTNPGAIVNDTQTKPDSIFITNYLLNKNGDTISVGSKTIKNHDKKKQN